MLLVDSNQKENQKKIILASATQLGTDIVKNLIGNQISAFDPREPEASTAELIATSLTSALGEK